MMTLSPLQEARTNYKIRLPKTLEQLETLSLQKGDKTTSVADTDQLKSLFPHTFGQPLLSFVQSEKKTHKPLKVGVVLSGGQAPGGHNVIAGLFDALQRLNSASTLFGFIEGPSGIVNNQTKQITAENLDPYRNQGGFDIIGSGRTKIETKEQLKNTANTVRELNLDGLVVIGGDDSNTNAALLANFFKAEGIGTSVVGVPKTIDGDLKSPDIEVSFGFDTACKVYSELIGNILRDCISAKKYYHFIKLMGRSASHITLECALQTHPNMTLISEEVAKHAKTLQQITNEICDMICTRAEQGKLFGGILVPEGLIEFIPEMQALITELNDLLAHNKLPVTEHLTDNALKTFTSLPESIQAQLLEDRDPHGNVQVSRIATEQLLIKTVEKELKQRNVTFKFSSQHHFLGYEGRSAMPSNFDCHYCYALGHVAALLLNSELSGYMAAVQNLAQPVESWKIAGIPLTMMMNMEQRHGEAKPVIQKSLVDLDGKPFQVFQSRRDSWKTDDSYRYPGPIQFFGDQACTDATNITLQHENTSS